MHIIGLSRESARSYAVSHRIQGVGGARRQRQFSRCKVLAQMCSRRGSWNEKDVLRPPQKPCECHLHRGGPQLRRHLR
jgi:hypothetical protein